MINYKVYDIDYDTDGDDAILADLPSIIEIGVEESIASDQYELEDYLSDKISELTSYCHNGFNFKKLESENDTSYSIELSGSKNIPYYQLISEKMEVIDMMFDSIEKAEQYANQKGLALTNNSEECIGLEI